MGFKNGAFAKVWSVEPGESGKYVKARISISRKNPEGGYNQEFSGFVTLVGEANNAARKSLNAGDRIKIGGTDVTTRYDKNTQKEYINYLVFSYEKEVDRMNMPAESPAEPAHVEAVESTPESPESTDLPF